MSSKDLFKNKKEIKGLSGFDSFLSNDAEKVPAIMVPLSDLYEFEGHPFKVIDEQLTELVDSIKDQGVVEPGIVRPRKKGGYEIISGHRRKRASELAGLSEMPVRVMNYDDDVATIIMVDSNLHREVILPSEKAKAYAQKYEHMKHMGKAGMGNSLSDLAEQSGEGTKTIQRYICLARLIDELLDQIDVGVIPFMVGVELSYLTSEQQNMVYEEFIFLYESKIIGKINLDQASMLRKVAENPESEFDKNIIINILQAEKLPTKPKPFKFKVNRMGHYFKSNTDPEKIEDTVYGLLDIWKSNPDNELFKSLTEQPRAER